MDKYYTPPKPGKQKDDGTAGDPTPDPVVSAIENAGRKSMLTDLEKMRFMSDRTARLVPDLDPVFDGMSAVENDLNDLAAQRRTSKINWQQLDRDASNYTDAVALFKKSVDDVSAQFKVP